MTPASTDAQDDARARLTAALVRTGEGDRSALRTVYDSTHAKLFGKSGTTEVAMPARLRAWLVDGATLAVSLEPAGGSPTGLPTGPVIALGGLVTI